MRSFGSAITALVTIGYFALTTFSAPSAQRGGGHGNHGTPPSTSSSSSSDDSSSSSTTTTTTSDTVDTVSAGQGTAGYATILNKCTFETYLYVAEQDPAIAGWNNTIAVGKTYSEAYYPSSVGGRSIKISITEGSGDILQFEYTNEGNGKVSYDLSEFNGNPFGPYGFSLTNTSTTVYCEAPATSCPSIFTTATNGIPYTASTSDGVGAVLCGS